MKAVILAAGKGTRMKEITKSIPKPMALIHGKPMLEHIIEFIKNTGITDFGLVVGYKQSVVQEHFGDGMTLGISITYIEQREQNGTGAALALAREFIDGEHFFFSFGDVITPKVNYQGMIDYYRSAGCETRRGLSGVGGASDGGGGWLEVGGAGVRPK